MPVGAHNLSLRQVLHSLVRVKTARESILTSHKKFLDHHIMTELTASAILKNGNTAVITGASSGIGRAAAMHCASKGMNVWLVDIDADELAAAKTLVEQQAPSSNQVRTSKEFTSVV